MSTSLAEQLRRLATPQTSILRDRKKFPSLLFDPKEAAEKDRKTIFDIGCSGLDELIQMNAAFMEFRETLFNPAAIELERSVEDSKVNEQLNRVIRKFLYNLSPYFMLQPSHKCLEWLIRRFRIQDYNKDEFMSLILPYHETRVAVRCIQTMPLKNPNDKWHWLLDVKKSGQPISKQAIVNHGVANPSFLGFIGDFVCDAVNKLGLKANNLQVMFNFYCITTIAVFDTHKINENHLTSVTKAIKKGFESDILDLSAASFMIVSHMVTTVQLHEKMLNIYAILGFHPSNSKMMEELVGMLLVIYQSQERLTTVNEKLLEKILESKSIIGVLDRLYNKNLDVLAFLLPLLKTCLYHIQNETQFTDECKTMCDKILTEMAFSHKDIQQIIKTILESYVSKLTDTKNSTLNGTVITLDDSDDEMGIQPKKFVTEWYSNYLHKCERMYPGPFDEVIQEITHAQKTQKKSNALKNVLGFLLKVSCSQGEHNIFECLYDQQVDRRVIAVQYIVENFARLSQASGGQNLLKTGLIERFNDDDPQIIMELLKLGTGNLLYIFEVNDFLKECSKILTKCIEIPNVWGPIASDTFQILVQKDIWKGNETKIIFLILPFLKPTLKETGFSFLDGKKSKYVVDLNDKGGPVSKKVTKLLQAAHEKGTLVPEPNNLLDAIEDFADKSDVYSLYKVIYLINSIRNGVDVELGTRILQITQLVLKDVKNDDMKFTILMSAIKNLTSSVDFDEKDCNISQAGESLRLKISLFILIVEKFVTAVDPKHKELANVIFSSFLNNFYKSPEAKFDFMSQFFNAHSILDEDHLLISPQNQFNVMKLMDSLIKKYPENLNLTDSTVIRMLFGFTCHNDVIRKVTFEVFQSLTMTDFGKKHGSGWSIFVNKLVERKEELIVDCEQLPLIMDNILSAKEKSKVKEKKALDSILKIFLQTLDSNSEFSICETGCILRILKHISSPEIFEKGARFGDLFLTLVEDLQPLALKTYESLVLNELISRINQNSIKLASKEPHVWNFIRKAIKCSKFMQIPGLKSTPVTCFVLETIDEDVYKSLAEKLRSDLIETTIQIIVSANSNAIHASAGKMFKRITVGHKIVLEHLQKMLEVCPDISEKRDKRASLPESPMSNTLGMMDWKYGVLILEFMQTKLKVDKPYELITILFDILKRCLVFEEQFLVEYEKQLLLTAILNCCQGQIPPKTLKTMDKIIKIDLIIECVRGTENPQTHHDALLLLSHVALFIPEQVLHNIVGIFTFMGSSIARYDDAYSFQILSKVIESVIPIVVKHQKNNEQVVPVLKVFSDIILDVPAHRRVIVYTKLIQILGPQQYLWQFICVLFESHIRHFGKEPKEKKTPLRMMMDQDADELPERIQMASNITKQFVPETILQTCTSLINFLINLPIQEDELKDFLKQSSQKSSEFSLFDVKVHDHKQLRFFKYTTLQFINSVLSSSEMVSAVVNVQETKDFKDNCSDFIAHTLKYIPVVTRASGGQVNQKYWKIVLSYCYDILESAISLLTPDTFVDTVQDLIQGPELITVKMKVIEMLITKLQTQRTYFDDCSPEILLATLPQFILIIATINDDSKLPQGATTSEYWTLQQLALVCVKLLIRLEPITESDLLKDLLVTCVIKLESHETICDKVLGSLILCVAELCSTLQTHCLPYLTKIIPTIIQILEKKDAFKPDIILLSIVAGIHKIVESQINFLSPYLSSLIIQLSRVYTEALSSTSNDTKTSTLLLKMKLLWANFAKVPSRVIIPAINNSYKEIIKRHSFRAVGPVMDLITGCFSNISGNEFTTLQGDLTAFFVKALQFRCDGRKVKAGHEKVSEKDLEVVEEYVIKAFTALILKLSEGSFRPLYFKIQNWALTDQGASKERAITFFKLSFAVAESLKSLFGLFANDLIQPSAQILNETNVSKTKEMYFDSEIKNLVLLEHVLRTIKSVCINDGQKFMNAHRFGILMEPVVDQIENTLIIERDNLKKLLTETIASMVQAVADDTLWKQLNLHLLEKTRHDSAEIKIFALETCIEVARRLGEDYLQLLPETIPFFAELMESDVHEVERSVQKALQELEKIVGEDLQKYF